MPQVAIQHLCAGLRHPDEGIVESAKESLIASTLEALSLILSLLVCTPYRAPQFSQLNMTDGSMSHQQAPPKPAKVLVRSATYCYMLIAAFTVHHSTCKCALGLSFGWWSCSFTVTPCLTD